ncbi:hypothetical protein E5676_scaffold120G002950 [Cucumis melo var. makuwa]|uniref:Uncharacterized protein n=1 Tax=Cucumis melo var. makuwa TaxID=1194695 RepID=A0A5A7US41_CUCMM|nr:hypothetical protein E6C27_scaffold186G001100 [Cucumis melo var. makuwa]TYK29146.1 hypothetical protein E5676_scaffold120G002950 [Cucumis melo var. makuwa]
MCTFWTTAAGHVGGEEDFIPTKKKHATRSWHNRVVRMRIEVSLQGWGVYDITHTRCHDHNLSNTGRAIVRYLFYLINKTTVQNPKVEDKLVASRSLTHFQLVSSIRRFFHFTSLVDSSCGSSTLSYLIDHDFFNIFIFLLTPVDVWSSDDVTLHVFGILMTGL